MPSFIAGIVTPRAAAPDVDPFTSPVGERSLTLALEQAGQLPELTPRTADIQRTSTLVAAWEETDDRALKTAILDELRVRQVPVARTFAEEMVASPQAPDRFIGAAQLRSMGDPAATEALVEALARETDPTAELMEAYALSRIDDPNLDPDTRERIADVVPEEWRQQDEVERGGLFDLSALDGTALEELKPEFAWWSGELSRAALVQSEVEAAAAAAAAEEEAP